MTSLYGKPAQAVEAPWYHNPLAFFGLTFLAVFLGGFLALVAAGYIIYRVAGPPVQRKLGEIERKLDEWENSRGPQRRGP